MISKALLKQILLDNRREIESYKPEILLELLPHKWKLQHPDSIIKK